jgi:cardiolipin synthase
MHYSSSSSIIDLVHSGNDYFERLGDLIETANTEIHLQTYIFDGDETGERIFYLLKNAAQRGVKIYILLDGFASASFPELWVHELRDKGVQIRFFSPIPASKSYFLGRRLHHKIVVVDAEIALIGGINVADKYRGTKDEKAWLDYAVLIADPVLGKQLQRLCQNIFEAKKKSIRKRIEGNFPENESMQISILRNDWFKRKNEIAKSYIQHIKEAKSEVIILGSYFIPGIRLTNVLKNAAGRGVRIRLVFAGISDVPLMKRATAHLYKKLLKNDIELYEWSQSVLHAKTALVDGSWTTIGSFNLNYLSAYASIEMNVAIQNDEFAIMYAQHLEDVIAQCDPVTIKDLQGLSGVYSPVLNWISYKIVRFIFMILTYNPYKRRS